MEDKELYCQQLLENILPEHMHRPNSAEMTRHGKHPYLSSTSDGYFYSPRRHVITSTREQGWLLGTS